MLRFGLCVCSLCACNSVRDARTYLFLSIVGHYSLFPLLFRTTGQATKEATGTLVLRSPVSLWLVGAPRSFCVRLCCSVPALRNSSEAVAGGHIHRSVAASADRVPSSTAGRTTHCVRRTVQRHGKRSEQSTRRGAMMRLREVSAVSLCLLLIVSRSPVSVQCTSGA